jgi:hypothetical protein
MMRLVRVGAIGEQSPSRRHAWRLRGSEQFEIFGGV